MTAKRIKIPQQKFVNAVGIELEGAWAKFIDKDGKAVKSMGQDVITKTKPKKHKHDGSVTIGDSAGTWSGEIASKPLQVRNIATWIRRNRPHITNHTCGIHVHVSLKSNNSYARLVDKNFHQKYKKKMTSWASKNEIPQTHEFWKRLKGENDYCKDAFNPESQIYRTGRGGNRYYHLNYCYGLWKTIEFRMLPAFEETHFMVDSVLETVRIVENYLESEPPLKDEWADETEYEEIEKQSIVYQEEPSLRQLRNYQSRLFDKAGWISRQQLKLTGKQEHLDEYIIKPSQAYMVPENLPATSRVITTDRYNREQEDEFLTEIYEEGE